MEMERVDENTGGITKNTGFREIANRRGLKDITNKNSAGPQPLYPCPVPKRQLTEKNKTDDQKPLFAGRRPITRKFAASITNKENSTVQQSVANYEPLLIKQQKEQIPTIPNASSSSLYDYKSIDHLLLPMVEEIKEKEKSEEIEEVEMEDVTEDSILDIDSPDSNNPLALVDYIEDIYKFYRRFEATSCVDPDYMSYQPDINERMRGILIDWLIEVHYKFELMDETLYLTVNIIDRFLEKQSVLRKKLQLVGVTAMLLACKYEEVSVPVVEDLILITDRAYTREEILDMEKLIVKTLQFNMSVPTAYVFMRRFLKAAESDQQMELLSFFLIELSLAEYQMVKYRPSMLAASAIYTAQCSLNGSKHWSKTSQLHTAYTEDQLLECSRLMVELHRNAGTGRLTGVHRKYSMYKFGCVAKSEPALFLLE